MFGFCFHDWDKWTELTNAIMDNKYGIGYYAPVQTRTCKKCGIVHWRKIPKIRSINSLKDDK